ncbi:unnamed protein product [Linum trigynum]|uniref:Uncharacterized protein n=1 Tax=Linum trigynum TaxID=586398 RepID=A0AAV2FPS7_9ROSI
MQARTRSVFLTKFSFSNVDLLLPSSFVYSIRWCRLHVVVDDAIEEKSSGAPTLLDRRPVAMGARSAV